MSWYVERSYRTLDEHLDLSPMKMQIIFVSQWYWLARAVYEWNRLLIGFYPGDSRLKFYNG